MDVVASILWRRLDSAGHDACRLEQHCDGWALDGAAVFVDAHGAICRLGYRVRCDEQWRTVSGRIHGFAGHRTVDVDVARADGIWTSNGVVVAGVDSDVVDLDLGFTPATNLLAIRRLGLTNDVQAIARAAWFNIESLGLEPLPQHYTRRSPTTYAYAAPRFDYSAQLVVDDVGFVREYPGLWIAEG